MPDRLSFLDNLEKRVVETFGVIREDALETEHPKYLANLESFHNFVEAYKKLEEESAEDWRF